MESQHNGTEDYREDSTVNKAQLAMGHLSLQDQPLPTNSQIVQQKLEEMKKLLKNLNDSHTYDNVIAYYGGVIQSALSSEEVVQVAEAVKPFVTIALMYEWELIHNISKIEKSQFVVLSELLPLSVVPKLVNIEEIREVINAKKNDE